MEGKSGMTFITDENDRPLGENMPAELLSEGINFYICGFGTKYQSCFFFFFYLENVWVIKRYVDIESGQANPFCDLYSGPVSNLEKKTPTLLLFCFSHFQDFCRFLWRVY